jgi:acetyl-CoA carboxylase biotin carboxyl carrier protein
VTLTAADVAQIMRLVEESTFDELTLEMDGLKISLRRGASADATAATAARVVRSEAAPPAPGVPQVPAPAARAGTDPNAQTVASPLLGTFYRSPKPGAAPFVDIGSEVTEDTTVGIVEVMKLMNTVRAGVRGRVTEILAADGALVEHGEPLLRISK